MTHPSLEPHRFYHADPVARFLLEKVRVSPLMLALLSIAIMASSAIFIAWISHTLPSQPTEFTGLFEDPVPWVLILLINPVVIGYYLWSFQAIDKVIIDLEESDALEIEVSEINRLSQAAYRQKWRRFVAIASAIFFSIFVFKTRLGLKTSWTGSGILPTLAATIATFVVVYLGSLLVLNLIANIWILHRVFETKELNVNPLHPDRCGGLRSLSNYALKTAYLAGVLGLLVGVIQYQFIIRGNWQQYWYVSLVIPLQISLAAICFFGPLWAAHSGMQKAKEELLNQIARQFQADYSRIHENLAGDAEVLKQGADKIKELRTFYELTNEFPVWPYDAKNFRRFSIAIPASLLPVAIAIVQKLIETWLKKSGWLG